MKQFKLILAMLIFASTASAQVVDVKFDYKPSRKSPFAIWNKVPGINISYKVVFTKDGNNDGNSNHTVTYTTTDNYMEVPQQFRNNGVAYNMQVIAQSGQLTLGGSEIVPAWDPGVYGWEECYYECPSGGFQIVVIARSNGTHILQLESMESYFYTDLFSVAQSSGGVDGINVIRLENVTLADGICDRDGYGLSGTIFKIRTPMAYPMGQTGELVNGNYCVNDLSGIINIFNQYSYYSNTVTVSCQPSICHSTGDEPDNGDNIDLDDITELYSCISSITVYNNEDLMTEIGNCHHDVFIGASGGNGGSGATGGTGNPIGNNVPFLLYDRNKSELDILGNFNYDPAEVNQRISSVKVYRLDNGNSTQVPVYWQPELYNGGNGGGNQASETPVSPYFGKKDLSFLPEGIYSISITLHNGSYFTRVIERRDGKQAAILTQEKNAQFSLYPNPTNDVTTIELNNFTNNVQVMVTDVTGKVMFTDNVQINKGNRMYTLQTAAWPKGIYLVSITSSDYAETQKLLVE